MNLVDELGARCHFPDRPSFSCAVSGGPDSLALLVLAAATGRRVTAIHVDHGLRPGSADDARVVADAAGRFGADFESRSVEVGVGPNVEARARAARYAVLPVDVLTGHTADDQAETIVLNLLRGAGLAGLSGIRRDRRPLLDLRRCETGELCAELGLDPVRDPSNDDLHLRRNRVRADLIPMFDAIAERDVVPVIARQADHLREVSDWLDEVAMVIDATSVEALRAAPRVVASTALRRFVQHETGADHPPDTATLGRVFAVVAGESRAAQLGAGWTLRRTGGVLRVERGLG